MRLLMMFGMVIAVAIAAGTGYLPGKNSAAEAAHKSALEECVMRFGITEDVCAMKNIPADGELTKDNIAIKRLPVEGRSTHYVL